MTRRSRERGAEERGGVAHGAVVDDLGGTLHRDDGRCARGL